MTNMIVTEYAVVSGTNSDSFSNSVDAYLSKGWELHGGMNYQVTANQQWYAQALVKKTEEDTRGAWG